MKGNVTSAQTLAIGLFDGGALSIAAIVVFVIVVALLCVVFVRSFRKHSGARTSAVSAPGSNMVKELAQELGAEYIRSIGMSPIDVSLDILEGKGQKNKIHDDTTTLPSTTPSGSGISHKGINEQEVAQIEAENLGIDIPWDQPPFAGTSDQALYNIVRVKRSYGVLSAYEFAFLPGSDGAKSRQVNRLFIYDFEIPRFIEDPLLTPNPDDDSDLDVSQIVLPPDADADIRFLQDKAATVCNSPLLFDDSRHHLVVLEDIGTQGKRDFYRALKQLLTPASAEEKAAE